LTSKLTREAYEDLIKGDIGWLLMQPRTLERDHVLMVLKASADHEYGKEREHHIKLVTQAQKDTLVCRRILLDLMKSYEAYTATHKVEEEWDEYDTMMIPIWRQAAAFIAEGAK
jgi:hypothetical protein